MPYNTKIAPVVTDIDKEDMKAQYQTAITRLDEIINEPSWTNAKVIAAVVDLAKMNKWMLKVLRKRVI